MQACSRPTAQRNASTSRLYDCDNFFMNNSFPSLTVVFALVTFARLTGLGGSDKRRPHKNLRPKADVGFPLESVQGHASWFSFTWALPDTDSILGPGPAATSSA